MKAERTSILEEEEEEEDCVVSAAICVSEHITQTVRPVPTPPPSPCCLLGTSARTYTRLRTGSVALFLRLAEHVQPQLGHMDTYGPPRGRQLLSVHGGRSDSSEVVAGPTGTTSETFGPASLRQMCPSFTGYLHF